MLKLKQIKKSLQDANQIQFLLLSQKLQYSVIRIALSIVLLTSLGILGRTALQYIPSVEPLTSLAVLVGFFFGPVAGFVSGASGFYLSNFLVWGGQGPWTIFQSIGAGIAGFIGGIFSFGKKSRWKVLTATLIGVILYEFIVTVGSASLISFNLTFLVFYLLTSLPFSLVHIISSLGFSLTFYEFREQIKKIKGGVVIEQEILGFRNVSSDSGEPSNKLVPVFYDRRTYRDNKDKHNSRFRFIERNAENNSE